MWTEKSDVYSTAISGKYYNPVSIFLDGLIGHVRCINILTFLRGFPVQIVHYLSSFDLLIPKRLENKLNNKRNIEACPESLGAMLEYWYIELGILLPQLVTLKWTNETTDLIHNWKLYHVGEINHFSCKKQGIVVSSKIKDARNCAYARLD